MDAPHPDLAALPTDVPALQRVALDLHARVAELEAEVAALKAQLDRLIGNAYGRRSERAKRERKAPPGDDGRPRPSRHDHGRSPLPDHLERRVVTHDLTDAEKPCPCCGVPRACIGETAAEQLDCDPARFFVRRSVRKTYACRACDPDAVPADQRLTTAGPSTVGPIPKGLCGPGLLAYVLTSKFADHLPLHRLAGIIGRSEVCVAESTLGGWVGRASDLLTPLCQLMHARVLACPVIWTDDTRSRYLVPGRDTAPRGHFWVTIGDTSAPYTVFDFTKGYSAEEGPERFLAGYQGYVHADCLAQYESLFATEGVWHVACWAHARRKFLDAGESGKPAVAFIRRLYAVERELPSPDTPEHIGRRQSIRQSRSLPILGELKAWLEGEAETMLPKSPLAEAVRYVLNRWAAFERYTERGELSIDNNLSERTLRPIAVGRGNWTFLGSASAGPCAAKHYTVVGTCRHLGIDPFAYLRKVLPALHALGEEPTPEQLADLLPDRWAARRAAATTSSSSAA